MRHALWLFCSLHLSANSSPTFSPLSLYSSYGVIAVKDAAGDTYIAGNTQSNAFPATEGAVQTTFGGGYCALIPDTPAGPCSDVFVIKFGPDGNLIYATYLGGSGNDQVSAIATDPQGNLYVVGGTDEAASFPITSNALYPTNPQLGRFASFVTKISANGNQLLYSTYFPFFIAADSTGLVAPIAVDPQGNVFIAGQASSGFQTTASALQTANAAYGIAKISADGSKLLYATYFNAGISSIAVDSAGNAYVTGTGTSSMATPGALNNASQGAVVAKLNPSGTALVYASVLGSGSGNVIKVDSQGQAYVLGASSLFPVTPGAFQTQPSAPWNTGNPGFLAKLNATGTAFVYATYLAGSDLDIDASGNAYVLGQAQSGFPVTSGAFQRCMNGGGTDVFLAQFSPTGGLSAASYLGGSGAEQPLGISALGNGQVSAVGTTASADFPGLIGVESGQTLLFVDTLQIDNPNVTDGPCIAPFVQNGATFIEGAIAPFEIVTFRGSGIGPEQGVSAPPGALPTELGGAQVLINGLPIPLFYVQANQINALVPYDLPIPNFGQTVAGVTYNGTGSNAIVVGIAKQAAGLFPAVVVNQDGTLNSTKPAPEGSVISLFGTGGDFSMANFSQAPYSIFLSPSVWPLTPLITIPDPPWVTVNGIPATVLYAGDAPGSPVGVMQLSVQLPPAINGKVNLQINGPLGQIIPILITF